MLMSSAIWMASNLWKVIPVAPVTMADGISARFLKGRQEWKYHQKQVVRKSGKSLGINMFIDWLRSVTQQ